MITQLSNDCWGNTTGRFHFGSKQLLNHRMVAIRERLRRKGFRSNAEDFVRGGLHLGVRTEAARCHGYSRATPLQGLRLLESCWFGGVG